MYEFSLASLLQMAIVISIIILLSNILSFSEHGFCQHTCHPEVIDFSRIYTFIHWSIPHCSNGLQVEQYQISYTAVSELQIRTFVTNMTSTSLSCTITNDTCYFRVRAELDDGSVSSFSSCLAINDQLSERKVSVDRYQDSCFEIVGLCSDGLTLSRFRVDGKLPESHGYNVTYFGGRFVFCLKNVSRMVVVGEWCEFTARNNFCLPGVGVVIFLSRTEVNIKQIQQSTNEYVSTYPSATIQLQDSSVFSFTMFSIYYTTSNIHTYVPTIDTTNAYNNYTRTTIWIAVPLGMLFVLIFIGTSVILIVFSHKKNKKFTEQARPEPVYETIQPRDDQQGLELKINEAYLSLSRINMKNCPAYTTQRQINIRRT